MRLDLRDLLNSPGKATERALDGRIMELEDLDLTGPIQGVIRVTNTRRLLIVQGWVCAMVKVDCGRCLQPFGQSVRAEVEASCPLEYYLILMRESGASQDIDEELEALFQIDGLNVDELVRQSLLLELPIQPLCCPECKGLCPFCGIDRNYQTCECRETNDPRWEELQTWMRKQTRSSMN